MTLTSIIQQNMLREKRLQFIRAHQNAFDVEPIFPLELFEEFVVGVKGNCTIEASCKIEVDRLIASRFLLFFQDSAMQWQLYLAEATSFFRQVERQVEVNLNYDLLKNFIGDEFDFSKMTELSIGIDLRSNLADSSLKMHIGIRNYPEKIKIALALNGKTNSVELDRVLQQKVSLIGFDYYLDGRSEIELYSTFSETEFKDPHVQGFLSKSFSPLILQPLQVSDIFYIGLSKANSHPVLYYRLKDKKDLPNYFRLNDTAHRVNSFYQQQTALPYMWVGVAQKELERNRIDNIRLYYHKSFASPLVLS